MNHALRKQRDGCKSGKLAIDKSCTSLCRDPCGAGGAVHRVVPRSGVGKIIMQRSRVVLSLRADPAARVGVTGIPHISPGCGTVCPSVPLMHAMPDAPWARAVPLVQRAVQDRSLSRQYRRGIPDSRIERRKMPRVHIEGIGAVDGNRITGPVDPSHQPNVEHVKRWSQGMKAMHGADRVISCLGATVCRDTDQESKIPGVDAQHVISPLSAARLTCCTMPLG